MGKRESGIQSAVVAAAEKFYGPWIVIYVNHGDAYATVGRPDIDGCLHGRHFGFEVKNEDGELTKIQVYRLSQIRKAGGIGEGVQSVQEAMGHLRLIQPTERL